MSPFASKAQARYLFAKQPAVAQEFAKKTPSIKALPDYLPSAKSAAQSVKKRTKK